MILFKLKFNSSLQGAFKRSTIWITFCLLFCTGIINCQVCGPPSVPKNSRVQTKSSDYGLSEATYECDSGYEIFGPSTIKCDPIKGWEKELPFCGFNVAYRKPVNQSSVTRAGPAQFSNDGKPGNHPDGQECSETQKEPSPWWRVDLLAPQTVKVVRIHSRGCCGHNPLQDLEIRVGNSSTDLQRNPLCAWHPGTMEEGSTKAFTCARPLIGQYVAIQLVGVEGSLSLCEVEVFSNDEFSSEQCASPNLSPDTILSTFSRTCYEFHVTRGESFDKARSICRSHGGDLLHDFRGATHDYILAELDRRKPDLKTQLVWIGAQKEPGITARTWRWVNGEVVSRPPWSPNQPNNYNGEQNCVVLDGGRNWLWNDVGCNLDYLHFICQHPPLSCGSPDVNYNTTISGKNFTVGASIEYKCPREHSLVGNTTRECLSNGDWSGSAPTCKYIDCGPLEVLEHGSIRMSENRTTFGAVAQYICHENYTLIGNENRSCTLTGWSGSHPQCLIDWCPEPPQINGGKSKISSRPLRAGSTVSYTCEHGYVLIGEDILSCGLGGEWSGKTPTCRYVDCGTPARPDRGSLILINGSTTVDSIVKYECDDDYWLVNGDEYQKCSRDGKWSGNKPTCELISCDTPQVPTASYVVGYDYNVHSSITYHCDPGHVLKGHSVLKCLDTGEWDRDPPMCLFIDCKPLTQIPFGSIRYLQNTTYIGSEVVYSCASTHRLSGNPKRTCLETGMWSDFSPKCEEIRCPEPILADHSLLSVTGNDRMYGRTVLRTHQDQTSSVQTYKVGALAKYRCERGYKIVGDPLITCEENGSWKGHVPECIFVDCRNPPPIENGTVVLSTNVTYFGATALYECNDNFKLEGVSRRICSEDGTWGNESPTCVEITCPSFNVSEHIIVSDGKRLVGEVAKFSCTKGRYLVGNSTRTCLSNGRWTGKNPSCKPVDCGRPNEVENGRVIVIDDVTTYGGSAEYHCIPNYNRIGPYLRKCMEDGKWSGDEEPRCELAVNDAQNEDNLGTGVAISAAIIIILLIFILIVFLHRNHNIFNSFNSRNKSRPVKNSENVQAAERKEDQNAAVMSYSSLENQRANFDLHNRTGMATFNTFQSPAVRNSNPSNLSSDSSLRTENIYDQIPHETTIYDQPYEMRVNEEMYEPEPDTNFRGNVITINGISVR